jgi:hypothetical protein
LGQDVNLWYLLPFAGAYMLWETVRNNRLWGFYLALLVLQIPVSLLVLQAQWATRQWLIPQTLLYGALAGLIVKVVRTSNRRKEQYVPRSLAFGAVAVLIIVSAQAAVLQVQYLFDDVYVGEVDDKKLHAPDASRNEVNSSVRDMHGWIATNVPEGEKIIVTRHYASQLAFLDGMQHRWTLLQMDGCRGTPDGTCRPGSKKVAQAPPQPAVWFEIDENCNGVALSLTSLIQQMESSGSTYLLTTQEKEPFPANLASAPYLKNSGAFETVYSSYLPSASGTTEQSSYGLVLLKRTGQNPAPAPTLMEARTVRDLISCEKAVWKKRYQARIRESFPNGIEVTSHQPRAESTRRIIEEIYASQGPPLQQ